MMIKDVITQLQEYLVEQEFYYKYSNGKLVEIRNNDSWLKRLEYDNNGNIIICEDIFGPKTRYDYNKKGQLITLSKNDGFKEFYHYDRNGRCCMVEDNNGNITNIYYGDDGKIIRRIENSVEAIYDYDDHGNNIYTLINDGRVIIEKVYNNKNQCISIITHEEKSALY